MEPHETSTTPAEPEPVALEPSGGATATTDSSHAGKSGSDAGNMLPGRGRRRLGAERLLVRLIATFGIVAIGVLLGAILVSQKVSGWIVGLVIAGVTVILSALLWSSRQL